MCACDKGNEMLPARPWEKKKEETPKKPVIEGIPFVVYINGKPVEMGKKEALSVIAQIVGIMVYLDDRKDAQSEPEGDTGNA